MDSIKHKLKQTEDIKVESPTAATATVKNNRIKVDTQSTMMTHADHTTLNSDINRDVGKYKYIKLQDWVINSWS